MVKFNSSAISQRFRDIRLARNLTQKALADSLGITQGFLSEIESGKKIPSPAVLIALCHVHELNEEWLANGTGEMFRPRYTASTFSEGRIPLLREIPAEFTDGVAAENILTMLSFPNLPDGLYAFVSTGDFMAPTVRDEDIVVFQPAESCNNGDIVLIKNFWGTPILRRYRVKDDEAFFSSDNPSYAAFKADDEVRIIGRVVAVWRNIKY